MRAVRIAYCLLTIAAAVGLSLAPIDGRGWTIQGNLHVLVWLAVAIQLGRGVDGARKHGFRLSAFSAVLILGLAAYFAIASAGATAVAAIAALFAWSVVGLWVFASKEFSGRFSLPSA